MIKLDSCPPPFLLFTVLVKLLVTYHNSTTSHKILIMIQLNVKTRIAILLVATLSSSLFFATTKGFSANSRTSMSMNMNSAEQQQQQQQQRLQKQPYAVNLKVSIKPERRNDFISLIKENQQKTLTLEPAALQYVVGEDVDSPNTFYLHEEFIGAEGFDAHRAMPHAADWVAFKNSDPFIEGGEPILDFFYEYFDDNDDNGDDDDGGIDEDTDLNDADHNTYEDDDHDHDETGHYEMDEKIPIRPAFCVHVNYVSNPKYVKNS